MKVLQKKTIIRLITKENDESTYTLLQISHPPLSNKSQNLLAVGYPISLQTSVFSTNTNTYMTMH